MTAFSYIDGVATGETKYSDLMFTFPLFLSLYSVLRGAEKDAGVQPKSKSADRRGHWRRLPKAKTYGDLGHMS